MAMALAAAGCAQVVSRDRLDTRMSAAIPVGPRAAPSQRVANGAQAGTSQSAASSGQGSAPPPAPPEPLSPFDDSPVIFTIAGQHFSRGERVIVTVCLGPDHSITSADIFESSGDSKFDQLAVMWARRIKLREAAQGEQVANCGAVRVEVRPAQEPRVFHAPYDSLS
jgi:outer membrane biosynthesis protein TonB